MAAEVVGAGEGGCGTTVQVCLRTIGPYRPTVLRLPSLISARDLRKMVSDVQRLPAGRLNLVLHGKTLLDGDQREDLVRLVDGDTLLVSVAPMPPAKHLREDDHEEDDELKFNMPQSASRWKQEIFSFLQKKLRLPDILLMALFSVSLKTWCLTILWFVLAPIAHRWDLGPLYILGTGFLLILLNLGRRREGDVSAYSIFNEGFRELPGTLNAARIDRDIRAGQF